MAKLSMKTVLASAALVLVSALIVGFVSQQSAALPSIWKGVSCAKDYMVQLVRDKVISKSTLIREYNQTMTIVKSRYEQAEKSGELEGKDEQERENFYYKITVEELRGLKARIESGSVAEKSANDSEKEVEKSIDGCYDPDAMLDNWNPDDASLDEEDERELLAELEELERQARNEDEMGWSLTPEARDALKSRTKDVLLDLLNNEVRQIAMAILTAYLSGGSLAPVVMALTGTIKYRLADYCMNSVLDLVSAAMGRKVEIKPAPSQIAGPVPAAAAA